MVALITGATGGIGREFVRQILMDEDVSEVWAVARNEAKLKELKDEYGEKIIPVVADLSKSSGLFSVKQKVASSRKKIKYLINNAGVAAFKRSDEFSIDEISDTIDVNCKAAVTLIQMCLPHMEDEGRILNVSSASSFQPTPYINLYSSTKVFLRYYSRALNEELKDRGIRVTAVCPGWVDTEMLQNDKDGEKIHFPGLTTAENVVTKALKDSSRGKEMSVCTGYAKFLHVYGKLMPNSLVMKQWMKGISKYIN